MSSGYSEEEVARICAGQHISGFIQKPYSFSELQEALTKLFQMILMQLSIVFPADDIRNISPGPPERVHIIIAL